MQKRLKKKKENKERRVFQKKKLIALRRLVAVTSNAIKKLEAEKLPAPLTALKASSIKVFFETQKNLIIAQTFNQYKSV